MADYQRVIEFLRDVRQGGPGGISSVTEEIAQMAGAYAEMCTRANERLRQCSAFLQQGLRSEAIHLADETPNLLDLVAQLDLPDPQAWADFCASNGLPVPPALQLERAAQLNDAYAQDQPLEHLLSRHRLLALSRAPLRQRLSVMREIAQVDAGTPYWEKDIRLFEQARLKELPAAFHAAVKGRDEKVIGELMEEVNRQAWFELVPTDLAKGVAEAYGRMQRANAETELRTLVEPLRDAFAARSLQECQALAQRWKNILARAGVSGVGDDLDDEIKPVVAFIAEQTRREEQIRRFKEGCRTFGKMLDADSADAKLEAGYAKLREFEMEIPDDLARRYLAKKTGRQQEQDRRHRTRLIAIGAGTAAVVIVALVVSFMLFHASDAEKWAVAINNDLSMHSKQGLDQATASVADMKKNNPGMLGDQRVGQALASLQTQQGQYNADAQSVETLAKALKKATDAAAGVNTNQAATIGDVQAAAVNLQAAIKDAGAQTDRLVWADGAGNLKGAMAAGQSTLSSMRGRVLAAVGQDVLAAEQTLAALPVDMTTPESVADVESKLADLSQRVLTLKSAPLLDAPTSNRIMALAQAVSERQHSLEQSGVVAQEMQALRMHAGSAAEVLAHLQGFVDKFPGDHRATDFRKAADHIGPAEGLEEWHELAGSFAGGLKAGDAADTRQRLKAVTTFLSDHPDCPRAAEIAHYRDYLQRASDALSEKGTWQTAFADLLATPVLSDLSFLQTSDGHKYYTLGDIKRVEHSMNGLVSVSFEVLDPEDLTKRVRITIDPPLTVSSKAQPAPHTKVMGDIAAGIKTISPDNWDTFGIDLSGTLAKNDQMDLVVKSIVLLQALKTQVAVTGETADNPGMLGDQYSRTISDLSRQSPDQIPWTDPSKVPDATKKSLAKVIEAMPAPAAAHKALEDARAALFASVTVEPLSAGVLLKDDSDDWKVFTAATPLDGSGLWTVESVKGEAAPDHTQLIKVGEAKAGKFTLDETALAAVPQGSVVYVLRP